MGNGLDGHSFGNLFLTALAAVSGSFERALVEASRVLAVRGRILPSTLEDVTLVADLREPPGSDEGTPGLRRIQGESAIPKARQPIERVFLRPDGARAYPGAVRALLEADLIVAGPGSLFTSVLPNLLVQDICRAVRAARARKLFVCNVATQPGETDGFDLGQHMAALQQHVGPGLFCTVLANEHEGADLAPSPWPAVALSHPADAEYEVITADVVDVSAPWRHDSIKLAEQIGEFYLGN